MSTLAPPPSRASMRLACLAQAVCSGDQGGLACFQEALEHKGQELKFTVRQAWFKVQSHHYWLGSSLCL